MLNSSVFYMSDCFRYILFQSFFFVDFNFVWKGFDGKVRHVFSKTGGDLRIFFMYLLSLSFTSLSSLSIVFYLWFLFILLFLLSLFLSLSLSLASLLSLVALIFFKSLLSSIFILSHFSLPSRFSLLPWISFISYCSYIALVSLRSLSLSLRFSSLIENTTTKISIFLNFSPFSGINTSTDW